MLESVGRPVRFYDADSVLDSLADQCRSDMFANIQKIDEMFNMATTELYDTFGNFVCERSQRNAMMERAAHVGVASPRR